MCKKTPKNKPEPSLCQSGVECSYLGSIKPSHLLVEHCKKELLPDPRGLPRSSNQERPHLDDAQDKHSKANSHEVVSKPGIREQKPI